VNSLSPYHRAKESRPFDEAVLRPDTLYGQRLLNDLRLHEHRNNQRDGLAAEERFTKLLNTAFPEALHELAIDVHSLCDWATLQAEPHKRVTKVAILFAGTLINKGDIATSIPLLRKASVMAKGDPELYSLASLNQAIAVSTISEDHSWHLWQSALDALPVKQWSRYPALIHGCARLVRHLREDYRSGGEFGQILLAGGYAEYAYEALSAKGLKGTNFETSREAITLLIEIAKTQKEVIRAGLAPLKAPQAGDLFKLAAINAASNQHDPEIFVRALMYLATHHLEMGEKEEAKDAAGQALLEFTQLPSPDPDLGRTLQVIFAAAIEGEPPASSDQDEQGW
jgi:hypothetical protein